MNRSVAIVFALVGVTATITTSRTALAQSCSGCSTSGQCGSSTSPNSNDCWLAYTESGLKGVYAQSIAGQAVYGKDTSTGNGVYGTSAGSHGVYGTTTSTGSTEDGVYGYNSTGTASGVAGDNENTSASCGSPNVNCFGVWGASHAGVGVYGQTYGSGGYGVYGISYGSSTGVYGSGTTGVYGTGSTYGVEGTSTSGSAVFGYGNGSSTVGVYGECQGTNCIGVQSVCYDSGCEAAYFDGTVNIYGCLQFDGTNYYNCSSDIRLKKNVQPLPGALDSLLKLKGVTYEWKKPEDHGKNAIGTQTGFIAQDVEQVFPSWVNEDKDGYKTLGIPPNHITALEVEAIRTLKNENDALMAETKMLKERVTALESGHQPVAAGINLNGVGFGVGGLALAGAVVFAARRKREEKKPAQL